MILVLHKWFYLLTSEDNNNNYIQFTKFIVCEQRKAQYQLQTCKHLVSKCTQSKNSLASWSEHTYVQRTMLTKWVIYQNAYTAYVQ